MAAMTVYWSRILLICESKGAQKGHKTPFWTLARSYLIDLIDKILERETRFELATPTLARSCSTS